MYVGIFHWKTNKKQYKAPNDKPTTSSVTRLLYWISALSVIAIYYILCLQQIPNLQTVPNQIYYRVHDQDFRLLHWGTLKSLSLAVDSLLKYFSI